jgi:hypothetical protein
MLSTMLLSDFIAKDTVEAINNKARYSYYVHSKVNTSILSTLLAGFISLIIFYGRMNFTKSKLLKYLTYIWILLNSILLIKSASANIDYIIAHGLTYKRIGVFFYISGVLIMQYALIQKIRNQHKLTNTISSVAHKLVLVCIISSFFNWDYIIANHNFKHESKFAWDYNSKLGEEAVIAYSKLDVDTKNRLDLNHMYQNYTREQDFREFNLRNWRFNQIEN